MQKILHRFLRIKTLSFPRLSPQVGGSEAIDRREAAVHFAGARHCLNHAGEAAGFARCLPEGRIVYDRNKTDPCGHIIYPCARV